jgi:cyclic pyranopterin phosphate synthase
VSITMRRICNTAGRLPARTDQVVRNGAGLAAAHAAGLRPVKVNAVLDPQTGPGDAVALVRFCLRHDYQLRIIEQMPLDAGHQWRREAEVTADQVLAVLRRHFTLDPDTTPRGSAPAKLWRITDPTSGRAGKIGIIASVSHPFCSTCDRTRLTADGQIRSCLFTAEETDLLGSAAQRSRRHPDRSGLAGRDVGQAGRPRH